MIQFFTVSIAYSFLGAAAVYLAVKLNEKVPHYHRIWNRWFFVALAAFWPLVFSPCVAWLLANKEGRE